MTADFDFSVLTSQEWELSFGDLFAKASNPQTSESDLYRFATAKESIFRVLVASNPACPESLLETLSEDSDDNVRRAVARNPKTEFATAVFIQAELGLFAPFLD